MRVAFRCRLVLIHYDDQPDRVIDKVNKLLLLHGIEFQDDGEEHDGTCVYYLRPVKKPESPAEIMHDPYQSELAGDSESVDD